MTPKEMSALTDPADFELEITTCLFEVGLNDGIEEFNAVQQTVFWCRSFNIDMDMGGLSGYLYNHLPDRYDEIVETAQALRIAGASKTAALLERAVKILSEYDDTSESLTWGDVLAKYDPDGQMDELEEQIGEIRPEDITDYIWSNKDLLLEDLG